MCNSFKRAPTMSGASDNQWRNFRYDPIRFRLVAILVGLLIFARPMSALALDAVLPLNFPCYQVSDKGICGVAYTALGACYYWNYQYGWTFTMTGDIVTVSATEWKCPATRNDRTYEFPVVLTKAADCPLPSKGMPYKWNVITGLCERPSVCPENASLSGSTCTCSHGYKFDAAGTSCVPTCSEHDLPPTDPTLQPYEDGLADMDNVSEATRAGAACIVRTARARRPRIYAQIVSGYRPAAYQQHIREVYDKWQVLRNNDDPACADIKRRVEAEFDHHSPFAYRPGETSRHSSRSAVDISLSNYTEADAIAAECNMSRTVPGDNPHFEPLR